MAAWSIGTAGLLCVLCEQNDGEGQSGPFQWQKSHVREVCVLSLEDSLARNGSQNHQSGFFFRQRRRQCAQRGAEARGTETAPRVIESVRVWLSDVNSPHGVAFICIRKHRERLSCFFCEKAEFARGSRTLRA